MENEIEHLVANKKTGQVGVVLDVELSMEPISVVVDLGSHMERWMIFDCDFLPSS